MGGGIDVYDAASIDQSRALGYCVESSGGASLLGGAGNGKVGAVWYPHEPDSKYTCLLTQWGHFSVKDAPGNKSQN